MKVFARVIINFLDFHFSLSKRVQIQIKKLGKSELEIHIHVRGPMRHIDSLCKSGDVLPHGRWTHIVKRLLITL